MVETQQALKNEFRKPKSQVQSIMDFKEIQQNVNESTWDFDQTLKLLIRQGNMSIMDSQNRDCYMTSLLPHLIFPLSQQKIVTQEEAVEITMRLEASPVQDKNVGVQQIQPHLESMHMELQSLKIGKEAQPKVCVEVWCIKFKYKGHDKDHYPDYQNYLTRGGHVPLKPKNIAGPSAGVPLWCDVFQIDGKHATNYCHLQRNFVQTSQQFFSPSINQLVMMREIVKAMN